MKQTIKFLRGASTYESLAAAKAALNGLTHVVGQPVVALYEVGETGSKTTKLIAGIGKAAATGASSYEILATDADLQDLVSLFGTHVSTMANGSTAGHVVSSTEISFTDGEASINANQVALDRLAKINKGYILGAAEGTGSGTDDVVALSPADIRGILDLTNTYGAVKVGATTIQPEGLNSTLEFVAGTNITLSATAPVTTSGSEAPGKVTVTFDGTDAALLGTPTTPTVALESENANKTNVASVGYVKNYVDNYIVATQAMVFKGTVASAAGLPDKDADPSAVPGWTYRASAAFSLTTTAGTENVEVGDMIICVDAGTPGSVDPSWSVIQNNIDGAVTGPASVTADGNIAVYDGTSGKVVKDSTKNISNVVFDDRTVTATNGLELDSSNSTGALSSNVIIKHSAASPTIGSDSVVTGVTVDSYGHVATVSTTDLSKSVAAGTAGAGKYISEVAWDSTTKTQLNVTYTEETGKAKVSSTDAQADYLENKVITGTANLTGNNNTYAVTVTKATDASDVDTLALTCTIDTIDGGTF